MHVTPEINLREECCCYFASLSCLTGEVILGSTGVVSPGARSEYHLRLSPGLHFTSQVSISRLHTRVSRNATSSTKKTVLVLTAFVKLLRFLSVLVALLSKLAPPPSKAEQLCEMLGQVPEAGAITQGATTPATTTTQWISATQCEADAARDMRPLVHSGRQAGRLAG
ncbi:hypothetical protein Pcinc_043168 [Petrolisthes cinctipes]|uniref:Uncharacterized protein n=1 Tax=Petrolisthes cinctipes TaxID=88211 RepID=A0AAE1BJN6_PETCI|nr:hypothetical protein Pcinc_043168 [Petrolisthes cinctipes]